MTQEEFRDFLSYHFSRFTTTGFVFNKASQKTKQAWFNVLQSVPFDAAKKSSDQMFDDPDFSDMRFDAHPSTIRRLSHRFRVEKTKSQLRQDAHFVYIRTYRDMQNGSELDDELIFAETRRRLAARGLSEFADEVCR